jgi:uncharacterized protein (TIGR02145 family)
MNKALPFLLLCMISLFAKAQDIPVIFRASADSISVDSVLATNLNTNQSVVIPGNETLILEQSSGINDLLNASDKIGIYPNPFNGNSNLFINSNEAGSAFISVYNHIGQVVCQTEEYLDAGEHSFKLSLNEAGIYLISISGNEGESSIKAVCTHTGSSPFGIRYIGNSANKNLNSGFKSLNQPDEYKLAYSPEQIMHYKCFGVKYTTIFTDIVEASINYEVEFYDCTDPDGKKYSVVKVGDQIWMAENYAYLSSVSPPSLESVTSPYFYVYDYDGTNVNSAKAADSYSKYGALYNWEAANISCPHGWHLPSDADWMTLEVYLGMSASEAPTDGSRLSGEVGRKLKSKYGWLNNGNGNNSSGLNILPGGHRFIANGFENLGYYSYFWSSSTM